MPDGWPDPRLTSTGTRLAGHNSISLLPMDQLIMPRHYLLILPLLVVVPAAAQAFEDLATLDTRVAAQAGDAKPQPLDRRLRLAACPVAAEIAPPADGAMAIRCPALGWRIRVPVQATIPTIAPAAALRVIRRGDLVELDADGPGFSVTSAAVALDDGQLGKPLRVKSLSAGQPLIVTVTVTGPGRAAIAR